MAKWLRRRIANPSAGAPGGLGTAISGGSAGSDSKFDSTLVQRSAGEGDEALLAVVEAWAGLPEAVRAAIRTLVESVGGGR